MGKRRRSLNRPKFAKKFAKRRAAQAELLGKVEEVTDVEEVAEVVEEVKEVVDKYNVPDHKSWAIDPDGRQRVSISSMTTVLIKAVQELSQQIEDLKKG